MNNWTPLELDNILHWDVTRMAVAEESGEDGTPHLQGFVTFQRSYRLAALKKLQPRAHWEVSLTSDWNYENKGDNVVHRIDNRKQGKRKDLDEAYDDAEAGKPLKAYASERRPGYQSLRLYERLSSLYSKPRPIGPIAAEWYFGPTGSGKTKAVYDRYGGDVYRVLSDKWWDGYATQETVLIDDFRVEWCGFARLLSLLDIYPFRVEYKGGSTEVSYRRIVITCPWEPAILYGGGREDVDQIIRRLTKLERFGQDGLGGGDPVFNPFAEE